VLATAVMSLNCALRLSKAVDITKIFAPSRGRLQFLRREVVGVSPVSIFATIAATAPMETDSIRAIDLLDHLSRYNGATITAFVISDRSLERPIVAFNCF